LEHVLVLVVHGLSGRRGLAPHETDAGQIVGELRDPSRVVERRLHDEPGAHLRLGAARYLRVGNAKSSEPSEWRAHPEPLLQVDAQPTVIGTGSRPALGLAVCLLRAAGAADERLHAVDARA